MRDHVIYVRLTEADNAKLRELAKKEDRTISGQVRKAIIEHLEREGK